MRTLTLLTFAGALSFSAVAIAGPSVTPDATSATVTSVHVPGTAYKLRPSEFNDVQGSYNLVNGQVMHITNESRKLFVEFGGQTKSELIPIAQNTFVTRDAETRMVFDQIPFTTEVTLTRK